MASTCISTCVNDVAGRVAPVRATYVNLYKWPESDAEFIRSVSSRMNHVNNTSRSTIHPPKVVDSISCRQLYLRSYTFSREEELLNDKTSMKCYGKKKKSRSTTSGGPGGGRRSKKCKGLRKAKEISYVAFASIFRRLLSCTVKVDVVG
ncbi:hypothetical protein P3S67_009143 [Capsicum chacoense]|uniref:uncharacterized protein LOC107874630 n=1 Tax=Capsicum annuum TaxID=4072 RepID=UPI0007BEE989|nr:uncharacterized protein LOC107874630 [Capsicum annuum]KAF3657871.1 putative receptor-like protein kinase HERK 1-like [Capsicum annuum]KAF3660517.1 putative receptor-like protein kinase HERK 1-like [Capsicum annuum]